MINKSGQITLFALVAVIIVAAFTLFFLVFSAPRLETGADFEDPENYIGNCIRQATRETTEKMILQGGFVNPSDYATYNNIKVSYLCKNINYYESCVNQYPLFISTLENEIELNIKEEVEGCFIILEQELEKRNYEVSGGDVVIEIVLKPDLIEAEVLRDFSLVKDGSSRSFSSFRADLVSPLYNLGHIANEITNHEAKFCYFENLGYNILYKETDIKKDIMSDSTKIYTIKDKKTGQEMNIAVRGCAVPAGF